MSLFVTSLNSGSNGTCYYIGNDSEAVFIDAGISCRETEKRMKRLSLDITRIKAIFISHEHGDHICGAEALASKYNLPIYITPATLRNSQLRINPNLLKNFTAYKPVNVGELSVLAFPKQHDAADPHSFVVSGDGVNIGVFTDIGATCDHVTKNFSQCHAAFLEANYDEDMLENGRYPQHLKARIRGEKGHLSNHQALDLFLKHRPAYMSHLYLSHLSKDNNSTDIAQALFSAHAGNTYVSVASRYKETPVYEICGDEHAHTFKKIVLSEPAQLSLF